MNSACHLILQQIVAGRLLIVAYLRSDPGKAAIIPEATVSGYGEITRISTSAVEVWVNNILVRIGGWN
jgi:hypothetical protein